MGKVDNINLELGDLLFLQKTIINPDNGKNYSYNYIRYVLNGSRKNELITAITKEWSKRKEEFKEYAAKLAS